MRIIKLVSALAIGCSSAGCTVARLPVAATEVAAAQPAIEDFQRRVELDYVAPFLAGDVDRWMQIFDKDIVALHNRMPAASGLEAVRGFGAFVAQNVTVARMDVRLTNIRTTGGWAYTWGEYESELLLKSNGQPLPGHSKRGKVFFLWKKQGDGSWKIQVDMGNSQE